jgi:hypothetical protein
MIAIISDELNLMPADEPGLIILEQISDYLTGYEFIQNAIEDETDLTVYIRNRTIGLWLRNMSSRYPTGTFAFTEMDARSHLIQKWGISIPEFVANEDIVSCGILDLDIAPRQGDSFENIILEYFYDPVFTKTAFSPANLVELANSYEEAAWEENSVNKLVYIIYQKRLMEWRTKEKDKNAIRVIEMIESDMPVLRDDLKRFKILRHYKELGMKILGSQFSRFSSLKPNLHGLEFEDEKYPEIIQQIEYYLNDLEIPDSEEEFLAYVSNLSGTLGLEFDKVESFLKTKPELATEKTIQELKRLFFPIHNRIGRRLERLNLLLKPEEPAKPDPNWQFEEMMDWAVNCYLPYFAWADRNDRIDEPLMHLSDMYASWLYSNWEAVRANSKRLVYNILPGNYDDFVQGESENVMIVIDNLGWRYVDVLKAFFENAGFNLVKKKSYVSMLPSNTEISKKCLLAGVPTYNEIDNSQYVSIVEKGWVPFFKDSAFQYISDLKKLENPPDVVEHQTYVVNYLPIDSALHKKEKELGVPHDEHIKMLLSYLVKSITGFIERHNLQDDITIHVTSDHGSTRIPESLLNGIDTKDVKKFGLTEVTHRYAALEPEQFSALPDNLKEDCFFLAREIFGNELDYICARRGNRFVPTEGSQYVHGGLSPEETIVPYLQFRKLKASVQHPTILLKQTTYRYRLETVEFEIANPNDYPVEDVIVEVVNSNVQSEPYRLDWLQGKKKTSASMQMRFKKVGHKGDTENLRFMVLYTCNGKQHQTEEMRLPITMKAMFEMKDSSIFDDWD